MGRAFYRKGVRLKPDPHKKPVGQALA